MNKKARIVIILMLILAIAGIFVLRKYNLEKSDKVQKSDKIQEQVSNNLPKLIELGSDVCVACKMMDKVINELKKEYEDNFEIIYFNIRKNPEAAKKYKIELIPTQIFLSKDNKELFRHEGFFSKEKILEKWKELGYDFKVK